MFRRLVVVVSVVASAMLVPASPASADEAVLDGSYLRIYLGEPGSRYGPSEVELTPCGSGCTFWKMLDSPHPGFPMYLQGNRWVDTRDNGLSHSFNKDTLIGVSRLDGYTADAWILVENV